MDVDIELNLNIEEAAKVVTEAARQGLRDVAVLMVQDAVAPPPLGSPYLHGNNRRSIAMEVSGLGKVAGDGPQERAVNDNELESAIYTTSGYGGFLEIGTEKMGARPYIRPSLDRHGLKLSENIKRYIP
jgi:hypothetical protein